MLIVVPIEQSMYVVDPGHTLSSITPEHTDTFIQILVQLKCVYCIKAHHLDNFKRSQCNKLKVNGPANRRVDLNVTRNSRQLNSNEIRRNSYYY